MDLWLAILAGVSILLAAIGVGVYASFATRDILEPEESDQVNSGQGWDGYVETGSV